MKTIYKYPIVVGNNIINTYDNCEILSADLDPKGNMSLWVLVDTMENKTNQIKIIVSGTGWDLPNATGPMCFIDTIKEEEYVWHVFEEKDFNNNELEDDINEIEEEKRINYLLTGEK